MFRSRHRPRILPQVEHSLFSGLLARYWGNAAFEPPALAIDGFAMGVALHDWHYGPLDVHPLGDYGDAEWRAIVERGVASRFDDPIAEAVAKRHLRRLIGEPDDPAIQTLANELDSQINRRRRETPHSHAEFEWADRITRCCDMIAFDLGFENRGRRHVRVPTRRGDTRETQITYRIAPDGVIDFQPWPFSRTDFGMPVTQYHASGYPARLNPIVTFVRCVRRSAS